MQALKRELSLDLNTIGGAASKLSTECSSTLQQRNQNLISPNSNFTDNTSQSVTPSEFGYQNLQRQLSMHSLIATEENSPAYEEYENTPSNLSSPLKHLASPIKSTISITYNLKSPQRELCEDHKARESHSKPSFLRTKDNNERKLSNRPLLETSFDENTVYEQVKFFRNSVTEVNQLLNEDRKYLTTELENLAEIEELSESERESDKEQITPIEHHHQVEDIQMSDEEKLLYENVELRKPKSVYENLMGESMKQNKNDNHNNYQDPDPEVELDSLDSIKEHETIETIQITSTARRSPSNFSVKELANKFESSPVEQMPAFDFSTRHSVRKSTHPQPQQQPAQPNLNTHPERGLKHQQQQSSTAASLKQKLNKSQQITRSLDENAFIREFGNKNLQELKIKSSQQLPELTEHCSRRKSFDFTRPKTLNPPKRLPGMPITEEHFNTKTTEKSLLRIDLPKEKNFNNLNVAVSTTPITTGSSLEHDYESTELKITPTTENRISLIQNNVQPPQDNSQDVNNSNVSKVLSGVKLDRERIDRIKEERRQQLTQKYHTDSFKSKSKSDLNSSSKNDDEKFISDNTSLRVKSKSRADMRTLQKDMDNLKEFGRNPPSTALSETTLNTQHQQHRVRSISDEKNQNNYVETNANSTETNKDNNFIKRSPHSQHNLNRTMMTNNSGNSPDQEEFSARATVQKFERKSMDFANGVSVGSVGMVNAPINSLSRERSRQQDLSGSSTTTTLNLTTTTTSRNSLSSK